MEGPARRIPQETTFDPRGRVAIDDEHKAHQREHGVDALPGVEADFRDHAGAKAVGEDADRVDAEEEDEAQKEQSHVVGIPENGLGASRWVELQHRKERYYLSIL